VRSRGTTRRARCRRTASAEHSRAAERPERSARCAPPAWPVVRGPGSGLRGSPEGPGGERRTM
jgi:hypothetical protein